MSSNLLPPEDDQMVQGDVAHDAADSGNPVKIGGKAIDVENMPADVAAGDRVNAAYTVKGLAAVALFNPLTGVAVDDLPVAVNAIPDVVLAAGSANIGDVDVVSSVLPTGAATDAGLATIAALVDGLEALVAASNALLTTIDADTGGILTSVQTIDNAISGSEMQVDVVAALPAGTNAIGKLAANSGVDIGDVDVTTVIPGTSATQLGKAIDTAVGATDTGLGALVKRLDTPVTLTPASGDWVPQQVNAMGHTYVVNAPHFGLVGDPYSLVHEGVQYNSSQTSAVIITGGASERIVVTKIQVGMSGSIAGHVTVYFGTGAFSRGTSRALIDLPFAPTVSSAVQGIALDGPFIAGANSDDLMITTTTVGNVLTVNVWYYVI